MDCLHFSTLTPHSIGILHRPSAAGARIPFLKFPASPCSNSRARLNLRFKEEIRRQVKQRWNQVFATHTNPSEGSDDIKSSGSADGPPFLTILAGLVVLLFFCWIIGSIVMWLISLIFNPPFK